MKLTLKSAIAMVVAFSIPAIAVAPASAAAIDRYTITVDCDATLSVTGEDTQNIADGDLLTITFLNCSGIEIWDNDDLANAALPGGTVVDNTENQMINSDDFDVTVDGTAGLEINTSTIGLGTDWDINIKVADDAGDPNSTLILTDDLTLEIGAPDMMIREEDIGDDVADDGTGDIYMGGDDACQVEPGNHVYDAINFDVLIDGTYDFRAVDVLPLDEDMYWMVDKYPAGDPFIVVYEDFDPNNPEAGIVGCNDDSDDNSDNPTIQALWVENPDSLVTGTGYITDNQWPWFRADLEPGDYTIVYMPFPTISTSNFAAGQHDASSDSSTTWDPTAMTVTYEFWGPEGGIVLSSDEELATTGGVNPSFALWAGLGIVGVGVAVAVARRREQRA
jgi:hypothetical protein